MRLKDIAEYLKTIIDSENTPITTHTISRNREKAIGIFPREGTVARTSAVGGPTNKSYDIFPVTMLLRWGRYGDAAEAKAAEIYESVARQDFFCEKLGGFILVVNREPAWLGQDERGIFEHIIDLDVHYCTTPK